MLYPHLSSLRTVFSLCDSQSFCSRSKPAHLLLWSHGRLLMSSFPLQVWTGSLGVNTGHGVTLFGTRQCLRHHSILVPISSQIVNKPENPKECCRLPCHPAPPGLKGTPPRSQLQSVSQGTPQRWQQPRLACIYTHSFRALLVLLFFPQEKILRCARALSSWWSLRWDGRMASPTRWTWVWVNSGSWWWTGRPSLLQSVGSQRVRHDWVTELNWRFLVTKLLTRWRFTGSVRRGWCPQRCVGSKPQPSPCCFPLRDRKCSLED